MHTITPPPPPPPPAPPPPPPPPHTHTHTHTLVPNRRHAIIWTNAGLLSIWLLGTNFNQMLTKIQSLSLTKMHTRISSTKRWLFCRAGDVLKYIIHNISSTLSNLPSFKFCCLSYSPVRFFRDAQRLKNMKHEVHSHALSAEETGTSAPNGASKVT